MGKIFQSYGHQSSKILWTGGSGTGKTSMVLERVRAAFIAQKHRARKRYDHIFVFDHEGQFSDRIPAVAVTGPEMCVRAIAGGAVCFDPSEMFPGDWQTAFDWFCRWVWDFSGAQPGTKLIVADEIQDYLPHAPARYAAHYFSKICGAGRRRGVDSWAIAPMTKNLCPTYRGQLTEIYAFGQADTTAADDLLNLGISMETLLALPPGEFVHWQKSAPLQRGKIRLPTR